MLSWVEHEKKFYNLRARLLLWEQFDPSLYYVPFHLCFF